jgi:hypothetical protein
MRASLETARLSLALVREADRENLIALERDLEVMRFLNGGRDAPDDGEEEGAGFLMPRGGEDDVWAAVETRSGAFVGWFSPVHRGRSRPAGWIRRKVVQSAGSGLSADLFRSAKFRQRRTTRSSGAGCDSSASTQA